MCHICFKVERTLLHGAFCALLSFCRPCPSSRNGKQIGKRPPPPPHSTTTSKSPPPPPLTIAWRIYLVFMWSNMPRCQSSMLFYT